MSQVKTDYTLEDILKILREQYEVWEAVRREILPASLLEMSSNFLRMNDILQDMVLLKWDPGNSDGFLAYWSALQTTERRYGAIAFKMGLKPRRLLDIVEVWQLTMQDAASEYDASRLDSFRECLMVEADSPTEGECYVVVEVWGTTCRADVGQAVANARMATRFTGKPAYPAVAAFRRAGVPKSYFADNGVHWHRLRRPR